MNIPPDAEASQWIEPANPASAFGDAWGFFDRFYCISLESRPDRRQVVEAEFARVGLGSRVTFLLADKHPISSEQGIYESHLACLRAGLAVGARRIVVFEDDVIFRHFKPKTLAGSVEFLRSHHDWKAFFFGCFVISSKSTASPSVRAIRYRCTAHAYAVTREFAERIVAQPWAGVAYDDLLRTLDAGNYFIAYPAFAFQSDSPTDNDQRKFTDRARRLFGGMKFGQRWDEFSHRNWRMMIVMHLVTIALIAVVVWAVRQWR